MAGVEMRGQDILLEISTDDGATWLPIVCLQDYTLNTTNSELTTSNRCRGQFTASQPNKFSYTVDGTGNIVVDWEVTEASYQTVMELAVTQETFMWRATSVDGTYFRQGEGWISTDNETAPDEDFATFDFTITGTGELLTVEPT